MAVYDARGGGNAHIDKVLTEISIGYALQAQTVANVLFPTVRVKKQSDKYYVFGREAWSVNFGGDVRAPGTEANEIPGVTLSTDTYFATEHALQTTIEPEERENADAPLDPDRDGTELVTSNILLGREIAARNLVQTATNYAPSHVVTLSGTSQFNDDASDPIGVFRDAQATFYRTMGVEPNIAVIPYNVMFHLVDHPKIVARYQAQGGVINAEMVAAILGVPRVVIPGGAFNSAANPGRPNAIASVWGQDVTMAWVPPRPGRKTPAFGYEFAWPIAGREMVTDRWYEVQRVSDVVRVRRRYDMKLTAKNENGLAIAGFLIKNAVAPPA